MAEASFLPEDLREELEATLTSVFARAVMACDASSSLGRTASVRDAMIDSVRAVLAKALYVPNAQLSLQDRLPPELWLAVWKDLSMGERFAVSHVCSRWRQLATQCPDLWTRIDCYSALESRNPTSYGCRSADGHVRHTTDNFVSLALKRSAGLKIVLTFTLEPRCGCVDGTLDGLAAMLAPYGGNVVGIHFVTCPLPSAHTILSRLLPLSSLRSLRYTSISRETGRFSPMTLPSILPRSLFPCLELLDLPAMGFYYWPQAGSDQPPPDVQIFLSDSEAPFPALRELHYAPTVPQDILGALRDCPSLFSLGLDLKNFEYDKAHAETLQRSATRIQCLDLHKMPIVLAPWILPLFSSSDRRWLAVVARALPRIFPEQDWMEWYYPQPDIPQDPPIGSKLRNGAANIYRRLANATRTIFRATDRSEAAADPQGPPPFWWEAPQRYDGNGLQCLTSHFADLGTRVAIVIYLRRYRDLPHARITLRAADGRGLVRVAALAPCDLDAVPELLYHTWQTYLPIHCLDSITAETWLLPTLLSSLPDAMPTTVLELLFNPETAPENGMTASLEPVDGTRFPNLQALCFAPRDVTSAELVVLAAQDVAVFVSSLGAELPLRSIVIGRGVVVDDASVLECLACSVVLQANPLNLI